MLCVWADKNYHQGTVRQEVPIGISSVKMWQVWKSYRNQGLGNWGGGGVSFWASATSCHKFKLFFFFCLRPHSQTYLWAYMKRVS